MRRLLAFLRTTIIGGLLFLLPLFLIYFVTAKAAHVASGLAHPLIVKIGFKSTAGIVAGMIAGLAGMVAGAFIMGLFGQTKAGQRLLQWIENGVAATLPQFGMIHGLAGGLDATAQAKVLVVLVPTDAGWALGFVLEPPEGEWFAVFLPGSPQWSGGSVSYAHQDQVKVTSLTMMQGIMIMRRHGIGSSGIMRQLTEMRAEGRLA